MAGYCEPNDVYDHGLPAGTLANPARLASASVGGPIMLPQHGLSMGDAVSLRAEGGGSVPLPLVAGAPYFVTPRDGDRFDVAAVDGDPPIVLTTPGARFLVAAPLKIDACITWGAGVIDDMLPAHAVPLQAPYPPIVVMTNAELAAGKLLSLSGGAMSKSLADITDAAMARITRWSKYAPIRGKNKPASAAVSVGRVGSVRCNKWFRFGGLR